MKCNICGGEVSDNQRVCKYCGNIIINSIKKPSQSEKKPIDMPPTIRTYKNNISSDARVYQQHRSSGGYCPKCGRPLDGATNKCIVCDAAQVSRRAYTNEEYKKMEMKKMAAKKKKKKKNNSIRNVVLAIIGMIILFCAAGWFALNKLPELMGIGVKEETSTPEIIVTSKPKSTTDPDWEPTDNEPEKTGEPEVTQTPTATRAPVRTPVPVESGDPVEMRGGEYEYPSHEEIITVKELDSWKNQTVNGIKKIDYIRWEIYARHNYSFDLDDETENELDILFGNEPWYQPSVSDKPSVEAKFNETEKENIRIIDKYKKDNGLQ